ncbi:hypothetical protein N656DRAFT_708577 [Canariomyces notabilis]|uniref:O-methyltransferase domain-containing protein n=1 Tax=Canariomyces notabilis TaxID=2074819 RepID=A0AAN6TFN0_9PEZI|nr:hypothetical protein N656DRAFT_708577 [Canariomyces arenarius]
MTGIKPPVGGASEFLQDLARQVEIIVCLHWLAEFQILACIPLEESVPMKDLADLAGVPDTQLARVVRLTATRGFLHEPQTNHVAHTHLSAQFMENRSLLDAAVFMAEFAVPAALHMSSATQRFGASADPAQSAFNLALGTSEPFHRVRRERPKVRRQWSAYLSHVAGVHAEGKVADALMRLSWSNLGDACVVEVGAQSTRLARTLADHSPNLRVVVQMDAKAQSSPPVLPDSLYHHGALEGGLGLGTDEAELATSISSSSSPPSNSSGSSSGSTTNSRVTVISRPVGMPQPITDAAAYIIHIMPSSGAEGGPTVRAQLHEYVGVLRASMGVMLVLTAQVLPEPGSVPNSEVEAVVRARDLSMLQLANEGAVEMAELVGIIDTLRDETGKLVVINKLRAQDGLVLVLVVKYQAC